jgi:hypothetical protein
MNNLFNTTDQTCIAKAKIPNFWATPPHLPDVQKYSPYIMSYQPNFDELIKHYIHGAKNLGFFDGMRKLGILEQTCYPDENTAIARELRSVGIDPGQASVFNYGCDSSSVNGDPSKDTAAVLQFKRAGVTHIVNVAYANDANFSRAADQQQYHPKFAHMEDASATAIQTGTQKPGNSFNNTLLIETIETGAPNTPNYHYNRATMDCTKIMHSVGLPGPQEKPDAVYFGLACNHIAMFAAAAARAPALVRSQIATGLSKVGDISLAYPAGPERYDDPAVPTGGQYWRPGRWVTSCECWRVTDVRWHSD